MQLKLPSVPAYSFPKTSRDRYGDELVPGPGQYDEDKFGELSTFSRQPRTVIPRAGLSANRERDRLPGPADYETNLSSLRKKGQYVIGGSKRDASLGQNLTPGPGAYDTGLSSLRKQGVAPIKTGRENSQVSGGPGPGDYDTNRSSLGKKGIAVLKSQGHGDLYGKEFTPGPLDYDPYSYEERSKSKVGIKIAQSGRTNRNSDGGPGPASYEASYSSLNKKGYAVSKTGRSIFDNQATPGPGNYETSISSLSRRGLAKLGPARNDGSGSAANPGPADYDPYSRSRLIKGLTIPKVGRDSRQDLTGPGPAAYDSAYAYDKLTKKMGSGFAAMKAKSQAHLDPTPGPAYYESNKSGLSKKGQTVFSTAGREGSMNNPTPGPADYESSRVFEKEKLRNVTIPKAGRHPKTNDTPGPGQYDFIASVPDVPAYLVKRR